MKALEEIIKNTSNLCIDGIEEIKGCQALTGWCLLPDSGKATVICGLNEEGVEHVSISPINRRKVPTWRDMCKVKDMFWNRDEQAIQLHPKEKDYVHSVNGLENVLHLWAPVDGDWSILNDWKG